MNQFIKDTYKFNELGQTPVNDSYENLYQAYKIIESELHEMRDNLEQYKLVSKIDNSVTKEKLKGKLLDDLCDISVTAVGFGYRMGLNSQTVEYAQYVVSDANLEKFPKTVEEAEQSVLEYKNDDRYENVKFAQIDEKYYVVYGNPKGTDHYKVLKSCKWSDPQEKLDKLVGVK